MHQNQKKNVSDRIESIFPFLRYFGRIFFYLSFLQSAFRDFFFLFSLLFFVAKTIDAANLIQKGTVRLGSLAEKSNSVLSHAISFFS